MLWESPATVWDGNTQGWITAVKIQPGGRPGSKSRRTFLPVKSELIPHTAVGHTPTLADGSAPARRSLIRAALTGTAVLGAGLALGTPTAAAATPVRSMRSRPTTPQEALRELAAGNHRWRTNRQRHPDESPAVRQSLTSGQHPFAVVLGCIDSRVPPELAFDQGLGDLMTVRSGVRFWTRPCSAASPSGCSNWTYR